MKWRFVLFSIAAIFTSCSHNYENRIVKIADELKYANKLLYEIDEQIQNDNYNTWEEYECDSITISVMDFEAILRSVESATDSLDSVYYDMLKEYDYDND